MQPSSQSRFYKNKIYGEQVFHAGVKERLAASLIPLSAETTLLDIGCGPGRFLAHAQSIGVTGIGIDISESTCSEARKRGLDVRLGNAENLSSLGFKDNSFDVISFLDVLEHTFSPEEIIHTASRYLKDDGIFLICVPNIASLYGRLSLLRGKWPLNTSGLFDSSHLRWFTKSNLPDHFLKTAKIQKDSFQYIPLEPYEKYGLWRLSGLQNSLYSPLSKIWPKLWAYEFIFTMKPLNHSGE